VLRAFDGIVIIDEAYIDFADRDSWVKRLNEFPNLIVLQTFSKAWGLASLRLGMAFANKVVIDILNKIKPPYNISGLTQNTVLAALNNASKKDAMVAEIKIERERLGNALSAFEQVQIVYPTEANFFLVKMKSDAKGLYDRLIDKKIIVRDRSNVVLCEEGLRITVGTKEENDKLLNALKEIL